MEGYKHVHVLKNVLKDRFINPKTNPTLKIYYFSLQLEKLLQTRLEEKNEVGECDSRTQGISALLS